MVFRARISAPGKEIMVAPVYGMAAMNHLPPTARKFNWTPFPIRFRTLAAACRCMIRDRLGVLILPDIMSG